MNVKPRIPHIGVYLTEQILGIVYLMLSAVSLQCCPLFFRPGGHVFLSLYTVSVSSGRAFVAWCHCSSNHRSRARCCNCILLPTSTLIRHALLAATVQVTSPQVAVKFTHHSAGVWWSISVSVWAPKFRTFHWTVLPAYS